MRKSTSSGAQLCQVSGSGALREKQRHGGLDCAPRHQVLQHQPSMARAPGLMKKVQKPWTEFVALLPKGMSAGSPGKTSACHSWAKEAYAFRKALGPSTSGGCNLFA